MKKVSKKETAPSSSEAAVILTLTRDRLHVFDDEEEDCQCQGC